MAMMAVIYNVWRETYKAHECSGYVFRNRAMCEILKLAALGAKTEQHR